MIRYEYLVRQLSTSELSHYLNAMGALGWDAAPPDWETNTVVLKRPVDPTNPPMPPHRVGWPTSITQCTKARVKPLLVALGLTGLIGAIVGVVV